METGRPVRTIGAIPVGGDGGQDQTVLVPATISDEEKSSALDILSQKDF